MHPISCCSRSVKRQRDAYSADPEPVLFGAFRGANWEQEQMKRNPKQMMSQLQGCMDTRMMQQLGGQENLMTMMKEMNKMDLGGMFPGLK